MLTFWNQQVYLRRGFLHLSTLRLLEVGVAVLLLKKEKQILLVQDFSKNCQNWILEMFLEWNTAKSKFFEVLAERVCYHFLFVPFVFYLGRGIQRRCDFFHRFKKMWRRRANTRNVSFFTLYGGQFTFSTQLLTLNYLFLILSSVFKAPQRKIVTTGFQLSFC